MLALYEQFYMLALHEEKGTLLSAVAENLPVALVGAVLDDLALLGKLRVNDNHRLELLERDLIGDEFLDDALESLRETEQTRKISYWIHALSQKPKKSSRRITEQLAEKGLVTLEDGRVVWVNPSPLLPNQTASAKYAIKTRLRAVVLACAPAEMQEIALLSLLRACDLLEIVFIKDERKLASQRIHELVLGEAFKNPIVQTIEEIEEAVALQTSSD